MLRPPRSPSHGQPRPTPFAAAIADHVRRHLNTPDWMLHEIGGVDRNVDLLHVPPCDDHPFHTFVTSGMSARPMTTPPGVEHLRYAELMLCLPPDWPMPSLYTLMGADTMADEWPLHLLRTLARLPEEQATWLAERHSVPNFEPPLAFHAGTALCGSFLTRPRLLPEELHRLDLDSGERIWFLSVVPLYSEEMDLKVELGSDSLLALLDRHWITEVLDPRRPNVVTADVEQDEEIGE